MKRINEMFTLVVVLLTTTLMLTGCPMGSPGDPDGAVVTVLPDGAIIDPVAGTSCAGIPAGRYDCTFPCWSRGVRVCTPDAIWSRCAPDLDNSATFTCDAGAPDAGEMSCTEDRPGCMTSCGNIGLNRCVSGVLDTATCVPFVPSAETCDAGAAPVDAAVPDDAGVPVDAAAPPDDAAVPPDAAGPPGRPGCPCDNPLALYDCVTTCGFPGRQSCQQYCDWDYCRPDVPWLETCPAAMSDGGMPDAGPSPADAGPGTMADAGAGVMDAAMPVDASTPVDAFVPMDAALTPDATTPVDAAATPDAFVPPDATTPVDASVPPDATVIVDSGPSPMPPATGVYIWLDPAGWCPTGGSPVLEARLWDNTIDDLHVGAAPLTVPVGATDVFLNASDINATIFCRTGSGLYEGYISPRLTGATVGTSAASLGVRVYINGTLVPSYACWSTEYAGSTAWRPDIYKRVQFRATVDPALMRSSCSPGTATP